MGAQAAGSEPLPVADAWVGIGINKALALTRPMRHSPGNAVSAVARGECPQPADVRYRASIRSPCQRLQQRRLAGLTHGLTFANAVRQTYPLSGFMATGIVAARLFSGAEWCVCRIIRRLPASGLLTICPGNGPLLARDRPRSGGIHRISALVETIVAMRRLRTVALKQGVGAHSD